MPGYRNQLVLLDATREPYRCTSVRDPAQRATGFPRPGARRPAREPESASPRGEPRLAWRETWPTGLGRVFTQHCLHRGSPQGKAALSPDLERLLGAVRFRIAAGR